MVVDDLTEELDGNTVELTLLQFDIQIVISQFLKDLFHVVAMFGQSLKVDEDVVDVHDHMWWRYSKRLWHHLVFTVA